MRTIVWKSVATGYAHAQPDRPCYAEKPGDENANKDNSDQQVVERSETHTYHAAEHIAQEPQDKKT